LWDERFAEPWTARQLAETVGMTQDHLARCFPATSRHDDSAIPAPTSDHPRPVTPRNHRLAGESNRRARRPAEPTALPQTVRPVDRP
jgi:hypothetical protein